MSNVVSHSEIAKLTCVTRIRGGVEWGLSGKREIKVRIVHYFDIIYSFWCSDSGVTCQICVTTKVIGVTMLHKCYMCNKTCYMSLYVT